MRHVLDHILRQIRSAEIKREPYPHIVIDEIFPPQFYPTLLAALPKPEQFESAEYPGTGYGKAKRRQRQSSGLAYRNLRELPLFGELQEFLRGDEFCRALLDKFSKADGIPLEKHRYFDNGSREFTSVFDLQLDRRGYEILPHPDVPSKIVTFQFFLVSDDSLRDFGTLFCRTKNGRRATRGSAARTAGAVVKRIASGLGNRPTGFWRWLERTRLGTEIGFGSEGWYPWRFFDIVSTAPALPNHFMAFAPNDVSYHAVRMDIPDTSVGRTVIRGFIRSGSEVGNYIRFKGPEKVARAV